MAKDPVCGMFVEEMPDAIQHTVDGKRYFFCSTQCLNQLTAPEKELRKLKMVTAVSIALTIPVSIVTYIVLLPTQINKAAMGNSGHLTVNNDLKSRSGPMRECPKLLQPQYERIAANR